MANFSPGYFIIPVASGDGQIQIKDNSNKIRYTILAHQITASLTRNNLLYIKTIGTNNAILIDFNNINEAKLALTQLQTQIDIAKHAPPLQVDPSINSYIDQQIVKNLSYSYHFIYATTSWGVTHSLGYVPNVYCTDEDMQEIEGLIIYIDSNQLTINFNQNITGWCFCS